MRLNLFPACAPLTTVYSFLLSLFLCHYLPCFFRPPNTLFASLSFSFGQIVHSSIYTNQFLSGIQSSLPSPSFIFAGLYATCHSPSVPVTISESVFSATIYPSFFPCLFSKLFISLSASLCISLKDKDMESISLILLNCLEI